MSLLSSIRTSPGPSVAVELTPTRVSGVALEWRGATPAVAAHALEPLPEGALVSSLTAPNVLDRDGVAGALGRVLARLDRPRRIALVLPDPVAKVSFLRFEKVPARSADLDQLVRWQLQKAAPFAIEEAQITYVAGQQTAEGREFIVALARRAVLEQYEELATAQGAHAGLVDLATFNVVNAVLASPGAGGELAGDWLLVNAAPGYVTLAILRGPHLIFFRNRVADTEGTLADLVHQTAMYYEDRLSGAGFSRVLLAGASGNRPDGEVDLVRRSLEERLGTTVDAVDPRAIAALTDRISAAPAFLDSLTPLVGILVRGQETAA
jgi:hypothetical protein